MSLLVKQGGSWRIADTTQRKVGSEWLQVTAVFAKTGGSWKRVPFGGPEVVPGGGLYSVFSQSSGATTIDVSPDIPPLENNHRKLILAVGCTNTVRTTKFNPYIDWVRFGATQVDDPIPGSRAVVPQSIGDRQESAIYQFDDDAGSLTGPTNIAARIFDENRHTRWFLFVVDSREPLGAPTASTMWTNGPVGNYPATIGGLTGRNLIVGVGVTYARDSSGNVTNLDNTDWFPFQSTFYQNAGWEVTSAPSKTINVWNAGGGGSRGACASLVAWPL